MSSQRPEPVEDGDGPNMDVKELICYALVQSIANGRQVRRQFKKALGTYEAKADAHSQNLQAGLRDLLDNGAAPQLAALEDDHADCRAIYQSLLSKLDRDDQWFEECCAKLGQAHIVRDVINLPVGRNVEARMPSQEPGTFQIVPEHDLFFTPNPILIYRQKMTDGLHEMERQLQECQMLAEAEWRVNPDSRLPFDIVLELSICDYNVQARKDLLERLRFHIDGLESECEEILSS